MRSTIIKAQKLYPLTIVQRLLYAARGSPRSPQAPVEIISMTLFMVSGSLSKSP